MSQLNRSIDDLGRTTGTTGSSPSQSYTVHQTQSTWHRHPASFQRGSVITQVCHRVLSTPPVARSQSKREPCTLKDTQPRGASLPAGCPQEPGPMCQNYLSPEIQRSPATVNIVNFQLPLTKRFLHFHTCSKHTIIGYPKPCNKCCYYKWAGNRPPLCRHTFYCILDALLLWTPRSWLDSTI